MATGCHSTVAGERSCRGVWELPCDDTCCLLRTPSKTCGMLHRCAGGHRYSQCEPDPNPPSSPQPVRRVCQGAGLWSQGWDESRLASPRDRNCFWLSLTLFESFDNRLVTTSTQTSCLSRLRIGRSPHQHRRFCLSRLRIGRSPHQHRPCEHCLPQGCRG